MAVAGDVGGERRQVVSWFTTPVAEALAEDVGGERLRVVSWFNTPVAMELAEALAVKGGKSGSWFTTAAAMAHASASDGCAARHPKQPFTANVLRLRLRQRPFNATRSPMFFWLDQTPVAILETRDGKQA